MENEIPIVDIVLALFNALAEQKNIDAAALSADFVIALGRRHPGFATEMERMLIERLN